MTGNNKFWRASLAGLASVAMLATMGVTALTASAATTPDVSDPKVSFVYDGKTYESNYVTATYGDSLVDALAEAGKSAPSPSTASPNQYFIGYYGEDGQPFDFTAPLTADTKVVAKYADPADVVAVYFEGDYGFYPLGAATGYVLKGSTLDARQAPTDKADGQLTTAWSVTGDGVDTTKITNGKVSSLSDIAVTRPEGNTVATVTVKPAEFASGVKTLRFNGKSAGHAASSYALNAYADGVEGDDLLVDTTSDSYKAPEIITPSSEQTTYSQWVNEPGTNHATKVGDDIVNVKNGDTFEIVKDSAVSYVVVKFDSKGGSSVAAQRVLKDQGNGTYGFVKEPAAPTKDGYVFKGWLNPSGRLIDFSADTTADNSARVTANVTLTAKWEATTSELKVTFRDADYDGKNADVAVKVAGNDFLSADQAPAWTRDGYKLAGWYKDAARTQKFEFNELASNVNSGSDFVLYAKWTAVKSADVETALKYVPAVAFKDATGKQVTNDQDVKNVKGDFTEASWNAYEAEYAKVYQAYVKAQYASEKNTLSDKDAADLVNQLDAALKGLVFVSATGTNSDGTTSRYQRLYNQWADDHIYTDGVTDDVAKLQELGWKLEPSAGFVALDPAKAAWYADEDNAGPVDTIVTRVYRFFNQYNSRHLYTADSDERETVLEAGWTEEPSADIYVPANGSKSVYRVYNPYTGEHLYTLDANEANGLVPLGWIDEGVAFKAL